MKLLVLTLASLLISGVAAHAADSDDTLPAPPRCLKDGAPVPDDYVQLARDMMTATKATDRVSLMLDAILPEIMPLVRKSLPDVSDDTFAELQAAAREEMMKALPSLLSAEACVYVQHFSRDELSQLLAWYKSPLGQKIIGEGPAIVKESIPLGQAWGEQAGRAAAERVIARYRNKGNKT